MIFTPTGVKGALVVDIEKRSDERGHFARCWCQREFAAQGIELTAMQANTAFSPRRGTLRGLHFQAAPHEESKLVRCTRGAIYDVVVDLRPESETFCKWFAAELTADNGRMLFIPERCGHGYQTLADESEVHYQASACYAPNSARGVRFDDPAFGIEWPAAVTMISAADRNWPEFLVSRAPVVSR